MCLPHAIQQLCHQHNVVLVLTWVLPIFGHMCLCPLLVGTHITLGCPHQLCSERRYTMSNNHLHGLIWFRILYACMLFILRYPLLFVMFVSKVDIHLLPPSYTLVADAAATSTCSYLAPFVIMHPIFFAVLSCSFALYRYQIILYSTTKSFSALLVSGQLMGDGQQGVVVL